MKELNIEPDSISYTHFLTVLEDKSLAKVILFWKEFKSIYEPTLISFISIAKSIVNTGNLNHLRVIYEEMNDFNIVGI